MSYLFILILSAALGCGGEKEIKQKELWICGKNICQEGLGPVASCATALHGMVVHGLCRDLGYKYHTKNKVGTIGQDMMGNKYIITSNGCRPYNGAGVDSI